MYKAIVTNILTGRKYGEGRVFDSLQDAQDEADRIYSKKNICQPARVIIKGSEPYSLELVDREELGKDVFGEDVVFVYLNNSCSILVEEIIGINKEKIEARKRIEDARAIAQKSKQAREDSLMVLDCFIGLINLRNYNRAAKNAIKSNPAVGSIIAVLNLGELELAKSLIKELKEDEYLKKADLDKTITLINDLLKG